jgi:hypothetical protein
MSKPGAEEKSIQLISFKRIEETGNGDANAKGGPSASANMNTNSQPPKPQQTKTKSFEGADPERNVVPNNNKSNIGISASAIEVRRRSLGLGEPAPTNINIIKGTVRHEINPGNLNSKIQKFEAMMGTMGGEGSPKAEMKKELFPFTKSKPGSGSVLNRRSLLTRKNSDGPDVNLEVGMGMGNGELQAQAPSTSAPDTIKILNGVSSGTDNKENKEVRARSCSYVYYLDIQ